MWYPPPYEFEAYRDANVDQIKRAIKQFPSEKSFSNLRINEIVSEITFPMKQLLAMIQTHLGLKTILSN